MRMPRTSLARIADHPKYRRKRGTTGDRHAKLVRMAYSAIVAKYPTGFFRRQDVLELEIWDTLGLATITLLHYVYHIVTELIDNDQLVVVNEAGTELCVQGAQHKILMEPLTETYGETVRRLVTHRLEASRSTFNVKDIVGMWISDPQLSPNSKQVTVRDMLKQLAREDILRINDDFTYQGA